MGEMGHFLAQVNTLTLSQICSLGFIKLYPMTGIKKWAKVASLDFEGQFISFSK